MLELISIHSDIVLILAQDQAVAPPLLRQRWTAHSYFNNLPPLQAQSHLKYYGNRGQLHLFYLIALAKIQTQDFSPLALIPYWVLSCMHQPVQTKSLSY